jgi:hypothetical protein
MPRAFCRALGHDARAWEVRRIGRVNVSALFNAWHSGCLRFPPV